MMNSAHLDLNPTAIAKAVQWLKNGEVLAYPTEAVWGLGCDPYQHDAFLQILRLKQRPLEKGVILLADDVTRVADLLRELPPERQAAITLSWDDTIAEVATTWLLPISAQIPPWIVGEHTRVAVRVTRHPLCRALCQTFDGMLVSTSANPATLAPATTAAQVRDYFGQEVKILHGALGHHTRPSRIIDAVTGQIIRA